jgi:subtilisin-like proprotein convertase family protein
MATTRRPGHRLHVENLEARDVPSAPPAPTGFTSTTTPFTNTTPVTISTAISSYTSTLTVSGVGTYLHDLDLTTALTHSSNNHLDITLTSPAGTSVTITSDNGGTNDDVFNGTLWDDDADPGNPAPITESGSSSSNTVTDTLYANGTAKATLTPEEALGAFIGEDPNGTWTLTVSDDTSGDGGTLSQWKLDVTTLDGPVATTTTSFTQATPTPVPAGAPTITTGLATSTLVVSGAPTYLQKLTLQTFLTHSFAGDLDVTLTSPAGTSVTFTTDNGVGADNVFNGTIWDDAADPGNPAPFGSDTFAASNLASDAVYTNLAVKPSLAPEEPLAAFIGEDPNGTWTITINDDASTDSGSLASWSLNIDSPLPFGTPFVSSASAPPVTTLQAGTTSYQFTVTYRDNSGINVGTLDGADVRVTGPGGYNQLAAFVGVSPTGNGTPRTATYSIVPPGGSWDAADNGAYTLSLEPAQVSDVDGNAISAGPAGTFSVAILRVLNANDSGTGSLREALTLANSTSIDDLILFDPTVFATPQTISLLTALPPIAAGGGGLTIDGPGSDLLTVRRSPSATANFRILETTSPALILSGMRLTGGNTGTGAGIWEGAGGAVLRLDDLVIEGNAATGAGGGIFIDSGSFLEIKNSRLSGNSAVGRGGAIYFWSGGGLVMDNTVITGNVATTEGGGLSWWGIPSATPPAGFTADTVVVKNSTFTGNAAGTVGGGIAMPNQTGTFLLQNSTVSANVAGTVGGGMNKTGPGALTIENSVFESNTADGGSGGGLAVTAGSGVTVVGSSFVGNSAATDGGAISNVSTGTTPLTVQNSTLAGNTAALSGGGIAVTAGGAPTTVVNSTIVGNRANATAATAGGGGIARTSTTDGTLDIQNSVVAGNLAAAPANGPDVLTGATGSTVNAANSAIGTSTGYTLTGNTSNVAPGTDLKLAPVANWGGKGRSVSLLPGSPLIDTGSNALIPAGITTDQRGGAFARTVGTTVDIGAVELQAPFLPIALSAPANVTVNGGTAYTFTVTFADPTGTGNGVKTAGIIGNNGLVRVTGPNGLDIPATYVGIDNPADGTPRTATYSITPPGGSWDPLDSGSYTVQVAGNQVQDLDNNFLLGGSLATFQVRTPFVVQNANDSGPGSFRDALTAAGLLPGGDTITFDPAAFNTATTITLLTALPQIPAVGGALTVTGPGSEMLTIRRDPAAPALFRLFDSATRNLALTGLRLTGGNVSGTGGALNVGGTTALAFLDDVVLEGNTASSTGGAIHVTSGNFLDIRNSVVTGNFAGSTGGGINFASGGGLRADNLVLSGNTSLSTGGGLHWTGTPSVTPPAGFFPGAPVIGNSTIEKNTSVGNGGAINVSTLPAGAVFIVANSYVGENTSRASGGAFSTAALGELAVANSTVYGNTAATSGGAAIATNTGALSFIASTVVGNTALGTGTAGGGGIARTVTTNGTINVSNTVVAGNTAVNGPDILTGATGSTVNAANSAIGTSTGYTLTGNTSNVAPGTDLKLGPLANYGGNTRVMVPLTDSPLLNAGSQALLPTNPAPIPNDQRGGSFLRVSGAELDIGAAESQAPFLPIGVPTAPTLTGTPTTYTFSVTFSDPTGANNGVKASTINGNNAAVRVVGPNGFDVPATFVSIDGTANGPSRTATYSIAAPGGLWDGLDNGLYSIQLAANQVQDLDNNFAAAGTIGTFKVTASHIVTTAADAGPGSLRDAVTRSNNDLDANAIVFDPTVFGTAQTISLLTALPQITNGDLTVTGTGAANLVVRRDPGAAANFGIFSNASSAPNVTFDGLTITGATAGSGGGITVAGGTAVTVRNAAVVDNVGSTAGGIFMGSGTASRLVVQNSTISGNRGSTGGVYFSSGGNLLLQNSTVANNTGTSTSTFHGGGVIFFGTIGANGVVIENSTVTGNTTASTAGGGGINLRSVTGSPTIRNSTITGNTAPATATAGGGIGISAGTPTLTIQNTIIAQNTGPADGPDLKIANGTVTGTNNLIGVLPPANYTGTGDLTGTQASPLDPLLGPLGDNGGSTFTRAPLTGSPARNAGSATALPPTMTTDQRGLPYIRNFGTGVDIGAFEVQPFNVTVNQAAGQADPTNGAIDFTVVFDLPVTGFDAADIDFTGSTVGGTLTPTVTGSGKTYTVTVTGMTGTGNVVVAIPADAAVDGSQTGNLASTSTDNSVSFDDVPPTVTIDQAGGVADPTNTGPVVFAVHFNEPVSGFDAADIDLSESTVGGTLVAAVAGSGQDYTVTVTGMTGTGTVVAKVSAGGATDPAGNGNLASTSTDNSVLFDEDEPTVTIDQAPGQLDPTNGDIVFAVHFSEPVSGFTAADLDFTGTTVAGTPSVSVAGSGADYTVTVNGLTGDGTVVASIPAGAATDAAGNGNAASTSTDNSVDLDTIASTVAVAVSPGQQNPVAVGPVVFDVVFSEPVTGFTNVDLSGSTVGGPLSAVVTGSGTTYTVTVTGMTGTGTVVVAVPAGAAVDQAGNPNTASAGSASVLFDTIGDLQFSAAALSVVENQPSVTITVTRTNGSANALTVNYATSNGTATAGADYTAAAGTLNWANGDTTAKTFTIPVSDDRLVEGLETILLTLSNPTGGAALGAQSTATVNVADFEEGDLQFGAPAFSGTENGVTLATVTVTRTAGSDGAVSVDYATAAGTATAGLDFTTVTGTLSWAAGDATPKTFTVPVLDDNLIEGTETVDLSLSNPTGNSVLGLQATSTLNILDVEEGVLEFSSPTFSVGEDGVTLATITVTRAAGTDGAVTVDYATTNGTAQAGSDYTTTTGTLTLAEGQTSETFTIPITDDTANEGRETLTLTLTNPGGNVRLGTQTAATLTVNPSDGKLITGTDAKPQAVMTDSDGDLATVKLAGKVGTAKVYITDPDGDGKGPIELIEVAGTNPAAGKAPTATVTVTPSKPKGGTGDGFVTIGGVTGTALKSFSAPKMDLIGDGFNMTGFVGAITVKDVKNGADILLPAAPPTTKSTVKITAQKIEDGTDVTVAAPVSTLKSWTFGDGTITAPSITTVSITGAKKPAVVVGDFEGDLVVTGAGLAAGKAALNAMTVAGSVTATASITAPSLGTLTVKGDLAGDVTVNGPAPAATKPALKTLSVTGNVADTAAITAPSIGAVTVKKDLLGDITVSGAGVATGKAALGTLSVTGNVTGSTIDVTGNVTSVSVGTFTNSNLYAGYDSVLGAFEPGVTTTVGSFKVTGKVDGFATSFLYAGTFNNVTLASLVPDNGGTPFGVFADTLVKAASVPAFGFKYLLGVVETIGDFGVRII